MQIRCKVVHLSEWVCCYIKLCNTARTPMTCAYDLHMFPKYCMGGQIDA